MNKILFYKTEKPLSSKYAYQKMKNIIRNYFNELATNDNELNNCRKEIFPIIVLANYLNYKEIQFLGVKNGSVDAILTNRDNKILKVECTTSIDFRTAKIINEYNQKYDTCCITPRTKAADINKEEKKNYSDITFKGCSHKRVLMQQSMPESEDEYLVFFNEGLIDNHLIQQYVIEDIKRINHKIQKGVKSSSYKDFILVLSIEHDLPYQKLPHFCKIIYDYWINIQNNPFCGLFITIYEHEICQIYYKDRKCNSYIMPTPIFFLCK